MRITHLLLGFGLILPLVPPAAAIEPPRPSSSILSNATVTDVVTRSRRLQVQASTSTSSTRQAAPRRPSRPVTSPRDPATGQATGLR